MSTEEQKEHAATFAMFEPTRLFVCFDGSEHSIRALTTAISMAFKFNAQVSVAHAVPLPLNGYGLGEPYYDWDSFEKSAKQRIEKQLHPFAEAARKMGVILTSVFLGGTVSIAESLITSSEKERADMIVMGSRGIGGFRGLMMGSVSQAVAAHSKIPVMIVK